MGEEGGWRGNAKPRLQARFSPLVASLILSVLWGVWHLPLHLRGYYHGVLPDGAAGIAMRLFTSMALTIVFTWLYNRTHGNLLLMVLLHTVVNNTFGFWLPMTWGSYVIIGVLVYLVISRDKMWLPPATSHPAVEGARRQVLVPRHCTHQLRDAPTWACSCVFLRHAPAHKRSDVDAQCTYSIATAAAART